MCACVCAVKKKDVKKRSKYRTLDRIRQRHTRDKRYSNGLW